MYRRFQEDFWLGEGLRGGVMWELSMEESLIGEENFHEGGAGFSSVNKKTMIKKFFQLEVRSSIKTLNNQK